MLAAAGRDARSWRPAIERARAHGCGRIEVDTNETNGPALALYRSFGFESGSGAPGGLELQLRVAL